MPPGSEDFPPLGGFPPLGLGPVSKSKAKGAGKSKAPAPSEPPPGELSQVSLGNKFTFVPSSVEVCSAVIWFRAVD
ncbi:hypothetical protein AK812_SmicGene45097 [Symbiodinium microadriaticum]|uniref:Uncharacterized protein n=1 Tax=Symbiodinium microadriaticum TaxID=2951 RepID=A0A1Q9BWS4_SYMMI|nr:hypothetical protein AK812_SmicGene45097 [Symbiodinium microadriaticum]